MANIGETVPLDRHTYEDPFLDMAATKLPKSFKKLLELCQIYAMTHPQISPIIQRLAEYPITSPVYKAEDRETEIQHKDLFEEHLHILEKMIEWGLDYYAYGNCFVGISFPFVRLYRCTSCGHDHQASEINYRYLGGRFEGKCRKCKGEYELKPSDLYVQDKSNINLFRFEPQLMTPKYNRVTGRYIYYYTIPPDLKRSVSMGDKEIIDTTPLEYLKCIQMRRKMKIKRIFHFKRPTFSGRDMQWGFPLVMPALKDSYLNQVYKKADEAIALEHSIPLRVLYPESRTQDPMQKLALGNFKQFMAKNIRYWRRDKNAIITSPMPIGVTNIGGDGAAYSTIQARIKVVDEIMGAMMVTRGFVMGGENWSSQSISQRVMENSFLNYLRRIDACLQWVRNETASFLGLPPCKVSMKPFKKIDDVQMLNLIIQLAREKRISWDEVLSRMDLDANDELKIIERETEQYTKLMIQELMAQNDANAKALVAQTAAQSQAQGLQEFFANQTERSDAVLAETMGTKTKEQAAEEYRAAQQPDPQTEMMMAKAQKDGAEAQRQQALAKTYEGRQAVMNVDIGKQIALWAGELLSAQPDEKQRLLKAIHEDNPQLAQAVVEVAQGLEGGNQKAPEGGAMVPTKNSQTMLMSLMSDVKSPAELAEKLQLVEPGQQQQILLQLNKSNPQLFNKVMKLMNGGRQMSNVVDMRPLPEQKPPRREEPI